jgi:hypothetical protein
VAVAARIVGDDPKALQLTRRELPDEAQIALGDARDEQKRRAIRIAPFPHLDPNSVRGRDAVAAAGGPVVER